MTKQLTTLVLLCSCIACVPNKQLRPVLAAPNCMSPSPDCEQSVIERYLSYDLGFIEFTERGNLYDRKAATKVFKLVDELANTDRGVAVFVFVHGWKHNAQFNDSNVKQFREFLSLAAEDDAVGKRKVVGIYLGWRGKYTSAPLLRETTYWARKSVAEEIGDGGATEVFSRLHHILVTPFEHHDASAGQEKNTYVVIGHSFGGAIVLTALHDVLLKELIAADASVGLDETRCANIKRFADALILLNPAIEANKVILLKEASARCRFDAAQPPLMHVLSSDGDLATKLFFPAGQYANLTTPQGPKKLKRRVNGKDIVLDEKQLDRSTVGNLQQLRTGFLHYDSNNKRWELNQCRDNLIACGVQDKYEQKNHFTVDKYDPLRFIKTDRHFIKNHNDVFGCYVQSFITTVVFQTQRVNLDTSTMQSDELEKSACKPPNFDFMQCFNSQLYDYSCEQPSGGH